MAETVAARRAEESGAEAAPPASAASTNTEPSAADARDVDGSFEWLGAETLRILLIVLAGALWLALVPYLAGPDDVWPGWGSVLAALTLVLGCYALRERSFSLARNALVLRL